MGTADVLFLRDAPGQAHSGQQSKLCAAMRSGTQPGTLMNDKQHCTYMHLEAAKRRVARDRAIVALQCDVHCDRHRLAGGLAETTAWASY
jgi:hypothetical protein